jgi:hypothetical protein
MRLRTPRIRPLGLIGCLALLAITASAEGAGPERHWEVTFAIRMKGGTGKRLSARLALPRPGFDRRIDNVEVIARGLESSVLAEGEDPHVLLRGSFKGSRRVAVRYELASRSLDLRPPPVRPVELPPPDLLVHLSPTRILQSRSLLVREFLETHVAPAIDDPDGDLLQPIFAQTRQTLTWKRRGKTFPLEVIRRGGGQRLGIERSLVTFLRCARVPARLAEGIDLERKTRRKRVFWTEVWSQGRWWPVSASGGWFGRLPRSWVPLTLDGAPVLTVDPPVEASLDVHATRVGTAP